MWSGLVGEFIELVVRKGQTEALRRALEAAGHRVGAFEERSWDQSLKALADVLATAGLDGHWIVLECPMPGANHRADAVLLGEAPQGKRHLVVIELKRWLRAKGDDAHWVRFAERDSEPKTIRKLHPSSQVQGYRDYLASYAAALVNRTPTVGHWA